ncbi:MAG: DNA-directed RNA polymerase subunit beta [candidate division WS6 bacterium GW2011_GWB1_33_6]|uniref:DNA-directed RNA polymerase subunit beta n=1 Tax=candidate division WS6 bacterium GW2011_GWB1_33_6 TaxID=1619088 RepID=A0A0G0AFF1_9BACT|nr:MAG: DNA-directed RNA polymerase subunit beta [candidate division WS6 bacterium GW2011_GWB1_33_6]OGC35885.1 MAG: DNA-directed RNA polymerase subunit beta [candidate division WS6 bacterium RIFOXYB1_FULL_33_15]
MVEPKRNRASRLNLGKGFSSTFEIPSLIEAQKTSFKDFYEGGFKRLFDEINPVKDTMERMWTLEFKSFRYGEPYRGIEEAIAKGLSYEVPVYATVQLLNNKTGEIKEQEIFVADLPMMTDDGAFVVNGVRRVVTHQIVRAEGVLFEESEILPYRTLHKARIMPGRGPWYEIEVNKYNVISMRISPKRPRVLITELLRVLGYESDQEILKLFKDVDTHEEYKYIEATLARDFTKSKEDAIISIYNKLRPDESVTLDSAEKYIKSNFFSKRKFDLGKIGRYQLNRKLGTSYDVNNPDEAVLYPDDLVRIVKKLIKINNGVEPSDDIDHLCNRRIRSVGEVLERQLLAGIRRLEKNIKDKMSLYGQDAKVTPSMLVGTKTVAASIQSFFGANQLSTFMDQTNILAELENKRKVTAAGPGGIVKDRATFSIREVHNSQYAKFDPVTSPESANIGVVTQLSILAKINEFGFLESPYRRVIKLVKNNKKDMLNRILSEDIKGVAKAGTLITSTVAEKIASKKDVKEVKVVPFISEEVDYFDALDEENKYISIPSINTDEHNNILETLVPVRHEGDFILEDVNLVDHVDVLTYQQAGLGMALIPFVSHDDAMRALAGANMQRQGVPLVKQEAPLIGTGVEEIIARQSNWGIFAEEDGEVIFVDAKKVTVNYKNTGIKDYKLVTFYRTNDNTSFTQKPAVELGQKVKKGDVIADSPTSVNGELAIGINLRAALMFYEGYNYEDAVVISERAVRDDLLTSVHIREHKVEVRDTELGAEVITADIPHVNDRILQKLDMIGIVREGVKVKAGDILVGVVAPRGEKELTAEERLLRAIFGESASDVRDNSLRLPHGEEGIVIHTQRLSVEKGDKLPPGVLEEVKVWVADTKKLGYGDKISGRHGDKNTVASIRPVEDMPFTADGEPVDIVLTPTFLKRMNMGQAEEVHFGLYAKLLKEKFAFPLFEGINMEWLEKEMAKNGFKIEQKADLYDGRTGKKFPRKVTVGMKYVLKLHHIADEKVHARSTGPYTAVTQQPLGGKAQRGGQRFGEMEVWALEAHGAPYALQEMLTIKSDDIKGRSSAYKAIIHGEKIESVNIPESFKLLIKELNALCLNMELISKHQNEEVEE